MRWWLVGMAAVTLAGCSKAPDRAESGPEFSGNSVSGIAFTYRYGLTLPGSKIADLQEKHAAACEQLGIARCRITGLRYSVGSNGNIDASLTMSVAAQIARTFGRDNVKLAENDGATLSGADIGGTDVGTPGPADAIRVTDSVDDEARITRELARTDLSPRERTELLRQQTTLRDQGRTVRDAALERQASVTTTPMTFDYTAGRGTSLPDRLRDSADTALGSLTLTLSVVLWTLAAMGPPLLLLLALFLLWRRFGRHWWAAIIRRTG